MHAILALSLLERFRAWSVSTTGTFQTLVFFGVVIVLALIVFGWAVVMRQQPTRRHHHSHSPVINESHGEGSSGGFFHRRRHRRKKHRPTNPTLSETGGLPAPRDEKTPPKAQL